MPIGTQSYEPISIEASGIRKHGVVTAQVGLRAPFVNPLDLRLQQGRALKVVAFNFFLHEELQLARLRGE